MLNKFGIEGSANEPPIHLRTTSSAGNENFDAQHEADDELESFLTPPFRALLASPRANAKLASTIRAGRQSTGAGDDPLLLNRAALPAVPGYELVGELGRGGMGVVYRARQCSLNRPVAIKMILAGVHAAANARMRFRVEAEALARLQHPNVVQVHEVGEHDGKPFLAMEYLEGGNLLCASVETGMPERDAAKLAETLARAVHYMHQRGILHRDLKPTNVLLTADGVPKIADFGLAKLLDTGIGLTGSETLIGTPAYMAPEQASRDCKNVGAAADVYSLGAILYELLTGRVPFEGASALSTLEQVRSQPPAPPRHLRRSLSRDLETVCLKCLEKDPNNRYASAEALADDLHRFLDKQAIQARPISITERVWRLARRRPTLAAWGVSVAAIVCLMLAVWSNFRAADEFAGHRAEQKYQQFVQSRDEALVYGLLARDDGGLFLGSADANLTTAESAAQHALALAGAAPESDASAMAVAFPAGRKAHIAADCYTMLLVLASVKGQRVGILAQDATEQYLEALRILDRAPPLGLQTRAYHLRRACFLEQLGRQMEASVERDRAAALPLENALDYFLLGEEQFRQGNSDQAVNYFNRTLNLQPAHFWAQFFLAVSHLKAEHWVAAKAGLNACLTQQPDFVWAYLFRSFANQKLQEPSEAEADLQKALDLNPNADARYVLLLSRGILHLNREELDRAKTDFQAAQVLKPEQYNAYLCQAELDLMAGRFEQAEKFREQAMRLGPPASFVFDYHVARGRNLVRAGRNREAIEACAAALKVFPQRTSPLAVRARAQLQMGNFEEAERSYDAYLAKAGEADPDVFQGRGIARMRLGKYPEAVDDYTRVLQGAPAGDVYQHRGWAYFFAGAPKLALRDFSRAIDITPGAGDAYTGRGLAHATLGNYRDAVVDAEIALSRKSDSPPMMHNIACIFARAAVQVEADLQNPNRQMLAADYRGRAAQAVRETLKIVPPDERYAFWHDKVLPEKALTPVHFEKGFVEMQESFGRP